MARGFGTSYGTSSSDRVETGFSAHATQRSYAVWGFRSTGANILGRMWEKRNESSQVEVVIWSQSFGKLQYERNWSSGRARSQVDLPQEDTWFHCGVTYDSSNASNAAIIYLNGSSAASEVLELPNGGSALTNSDNYFLGNRGDAARNWGGYLAEFAIWDRILSPDEWVTLAQGFSPLCFPTGLACYVPLIRDVVDFKNGAPTVTGGAERDHCRIIYRGATSAS